jgi:predicted Zn-dependent protease
LRIHILKAAEEEALADRRDGRISAGRLLREYRTATDERLILITSRDLALRGCESAFGYAHRRRGIAVVSTFRLSAGSEERVAARVANVIAHERGHLDGLGHCRTERCIMHPARDAGDVDLRGLDRCARCSRARRSTMAYVAAAALCLLILAGLQVSANLLKVKSSPFSWREEGAAAEVLYQRRPVLMVSNAAEAVAAVAALNQLFAEITPPPIEASAEGQSALLRAGDRRVAVVDRRSAAGRDPVEYAQAWAARMGWLMRAKGTEAEGCPDCHIRRLPEVQQEARIRRQRRW